MKLVTAWSWFSVSLYVPVNMVVHPVQFAIRAISAIWRPIKMVRQAFICSSNKALQVLTNCLAELWWCMQVETILVPERITEAGLREIQEHDWLVLSLDLPKPSSGSISVLSTAGLKRRHSLYYFCPCDLRQHKLMTIFFLRILWFLLWSCFLQ